MYKCKRFINIFDIIEWLNNNKSVELINILTDTDHWLIYWEEEPQPQKEEQEEMFRFKAVPKPQEQRIEGKSGFIPYKTYDGVLITNPDAEIFMVYGDMSFDFNGWKAWYQNKYMQTHQRHKIFSSEEAARYFLMQHKYTQQQVDSMCEDAFEAGRDRIGGWWNDQINNWKYASYRHYKSQNSKQKQ